jgi:mutator protein MutT
MPAESVLVAAAVVKRGSAYLVTRRLDDTHLAGLWEFPGGKCEPGESPENCLRRELDEELGTASVIGRLLLTTTHDYTDRRITLQFYDCELVGDPHPRLGQKLRWVDAHELSRLTFPPADAELIARLMDAAVEPRKKARRKKEE